MNTTRIPLTTVESDPGSIPGLLRTAAELRDAASSIAGRRRQTTQQQGASQQAIVVRPPEHHLVDVDRLGRDLDPLEAYRRAMQQQQDSSITTLAAFQQQAVSKQTVRQGNWHETIVEDVLAMALTSMKEDAEAELSRTLDADWEQTKDRVLRMFADERTISLSSGGDSAPPLTANRVAGPLDDPVKPNVTKEGGNRSEETPKMTTFFRVLSNTSVSVKEQCREFLSASASVGSSLDACEMWSLAKFLSDKDSTGLVSRGLAPRDLLCKRALAARQYLEQQYREKKYSHGNVLPDELLWDKLSDTDVLPVDYAKLFEMCRCGAWERGAVQAGRFDVELQAFMRRFIKCQGKRGYEVGFGEGDIYRQAFGGLANFDFQPNPQLVTSVEDFIWFKLCAVTCAMQEEKEAMSKVVKLGEMMRHQGPAYFNGGSNPFMYARILAMCGSVEDALDYLARYSPIGPNIPVDNSTVSDPLPDAVHLAIVLNRADALRVASSSSTSTDLLAISDSDPSVRALRLAKMLELYSARFADEEKALFYVTCLRPPVKDEDMGPAKKILARPHPGGGPLPLLKVLKRNIGETVRTIDIAFDAAKDSRPSDAAQIYFEAFNSGLFEERKAESLDHALRLVARELSRVMDMDANVPERIYWKREAERFNRLAEEHRDLHVPSYALFQQVVKCCVFYDKYFAGDVDAPQVLEGWLLPSSTKKSPEEMSRCSRSFASLDRVIIDAFPSMISKIIDCAVKSFSANNKDDAKSRMETLVGFVAALRDTNGYRLRYDVENELRVVNSRIRV